MSESSTPAIQLLNIEDFIIGTATRTAKYEGAPYGANTSFFLVDNGPGQGPGLHWHPYPETWVVLEGVAEFVAGDQRFEATAGLITTAPVLMFALLTPVYWFMHSYAAWRAAFQMISSPHGWEKTPHGLTDEYESHIVYQGH